MFVHPHSATLFILHAHISSAVERSFHTILDCKPVLELAVTALEVVRFSFRSRPRTHAPKADRYLPKMGVTSKFFLWEMGAVHTGQHVTEKRKCYDFQEYYRFSVRFLKRFLTIFYKIVVFPSMQDYCY